MEKNKVARLFIILLFSQFVSYGQKVEINDPSDDINYTAPLIMSLNYEKSDNPSSEVILSTDSLSFSSYKHLLNAIDWKYNTKDELWILVEVWDFSTAECCECYETLVTKGWIKKEYLKNQSLFSKTIEPFTLEMINQYGYSMNNQQRREINQDFQMNIIGYGGTLFVYDGSNGYINIKGKLKHLKHISNPSSPNKSNTNFKPYHHYINYEGDTEKITLRIYEDLNMIELSYKGEVKRTLATKIVKKVWDIDGEYYQTKEY